jgi:hypothetical protein
LYNNDTVEDITNFYSNLDNEQNNLGFFNIKSLKILDYKLIPTEKRDFYPITNEKSQLYYVAFDMKLFQESEHFTNVVNYHTIDMLPEGDHLKISRFSNDPIDIIEELEIGFGTMDEKEMANLDRLKYKGEFLNRNGKAIHINKVDNNEMKITKRWDGYT